jgi:predicted nuclease with TOPRIM domain
MGGIVMAKDITNEQLFEFMTKMYSDLSGKIDGINKEMKENMATKDDLAKTNQSIVRLEDKMDVNHKALYDGYKQTYEKLTVLEKKVDEIDNKVEKQDVEIRVIKGIK